MRGYRAARDEGGQVGGGDPEGVHDANVSDPPLVAQLVDGSRGHPQMAGNLPDRQQGVRKHGESKRSVEPVNGRECRVTGSSASSVDPQATTAEEPLCVGALIDTSIYIAAEGGKLDL
jgi:hypothetical protein